MPYFLQCAGCIAFLSSILSFICWFTVRSRFLSCVQFWAMLHLHLLVKFVSSILAPQNASSKSKSNKDKNSQQSESTWGLQSPYSIAYGYEITSCICLQFHLLHCTLGQLLFWSCDLHWVLPHSCIHMLLWIIQNEKATIIEHYWYLDQTILASFPPFFSIDSVCCFCINQITINSSKITLVTRMLHLILNVHFISESCASQDFTFVPLLRMLNGFCLLASWMGTLAFQCALIDPPPQLNLMTYMTLTLLC